MTLPSEDTLHEVYRYASSEQYHLGFAFRHIALYSIKSNESETEFHIYSSKIYQDLTRDDWGLCKGSLSATEYTHWLGSQLRRRTSDPLPEYLDAWISFDKDDPLSNAHNLKVGDYVIIGCTTGFIRNITDKAIYVTGYYPSSIRQEICKWNVIYRMVDFIALCTTTPTSLKDINGIYKRYWDFSTLTYVPDINPEC